MELLEVGRPVLFPLGHGKQPIFRGEAGGSFRGGKMEPACFFFSEMKAFF